MERDSNIPKWSVIIDAEYSYMFGEEFIEDRFRYKGKNYCRVPTAIFVKRGGIFKAFEE